MDVVLCRSNRVQPCRIVLTRIPEQTNLVTADQREPRRRARRPDWQFRATAAAVLLPAAEAVQSLSWRRSCLAEEQLPRAAGSGEARCGLPRQTGSAQPKHTLWEQGQRITSSERGNLSRTNDGLGHELKVHSDLAFPPDLCQAVFLACGAAPTASTSGMLTRCSLKNQTCNSFVRRISLTTRSLVPSSPSSEARRARVRQRRMMIW